VSRVQVFSFVCRQVSYRLFSLHRVFSFFGRPLVRPDFGVENYLLKMVHDFFSKLVVVIPPVFEDNETEYRSDRRSDEHLGSPDAIPSSVQTFRIN